jgi:putative MFS transporter
MTGAEQTSISDEGTRRALLNARLDRLPRWGLSWFALAVFGACYMLSYYDISVAGIALPTIIDRLHMTGGQQAMVITTNLIGYTIGSYVLSAVADRLGRRYALVGCVLLLAAGALLTSLSWDPGSIAVFRGITGLGIGAQITLSSTFVGEFAPPNKRGRYLAISIVFGACGNIVPAVLAVPLLSMSSDVGWRVLFALPAVIVLLMFVLNDRVLPESPRWLAARGQLERAESIVADMEARLVRRLGTALPAPVPVVEPPEERAGARALLARRLFGRLMLVVAFWFCWYLVEDGFLSFQTKIINDLGIHLTSAQIITAVGFVGGVVGALTQVAIGDRLERKFLVTLGLTVFTVSFILLAVAPTPAISAVASFGVNTGTFMTIIPAYTYTAEIFPTGVRASAMGISSGVGHLAGGLQPYLIIPMLAAAGPRSVLWVLAAIAVVPLLLITFGKRTTGRTLSEIAQ